MAEAAQRYGIVIRDRAGVVAFYGEDPSPLATQSLSSDLRQEVPRSAAGELPLALPPGPAPRSSRPGKLAWTPWSRHRAGVTPFSWRRQIARRSPSRGRFAAAGARADRLRRREQPSRSAAAGPTHITARPGLLPEELLESAPSGPAPIDPRSAAMVNGLVSEVNSELARHYGPWINTKEYSVPVYTVGPNQPTESKSRWTAPPGPAEGSRRRSDPAGRRPAAGTDQNMVDLAAGHRPDVGVLADAASPGRWHAGAAGAMHHVSTNPGPTPRAPGRVPSDGGARPQPACHCWAG